VEHPETTIAPHAKRSWHAATRGIVADIGLMTTGARAGRWAFISLRSG
jgi:hypothetical protein